LYAPEELVAKGGKDISGVGVGCGFCVFVGSGVSARVSAGSSVFVGSGDAVSAGDGEAEAGSLVMFAGSEQADKDAKSASAKTIKAARLRFAPSKDPKFFWDDNGLFPPDEEENPDMPRLLSR